MSVINKEQWINRWIQKAEADLNAAEKLCTFPDVLAEVVCFHCQQAVEKALKGFLISRNKEIGKIHDLVLLIEECSECDPSFKVYLRECSELNSYAVDVRYPGPNDSSTEDDARKALKYALSIITKVKSVIKKN